MDNPQKLETLGTQNEANNTTQKTTKDEQQEPHQKLKTLTPPKPGDGPRCLRVEFEKHIFRQ